jgi:hypothetical protein
MPRTSDAELVKLLRTAGRYITRSRAVGSGAFYREVRNAADALEAASAEPFLDTTMFRASNGLFVYGCPRPRRKDARPHRPARR